MLQEHERISALAGQAFKQGGQMAWVSVHCFWAEDHFGYLGSDYETQQTFPAFSADWYRFSRPCFLVLGGGQ